MVVLGRELKLDEAEYRAQTDSIAQLLLDSLRHFRQAIALEEVDESRGFVDGGDGDGTEEQGGSGGGGGGAGPVFRVVALWFEPQNAADARVNEEMAAFAAEVPTHKVVPLIYQVWAHIYDIYLDWCGRTTVWPCPRLSVPPPTFYTCEQILSRLGSGTQPFARAVETLVYRACKEHPFHTLLQVGAPTSLACTRESAIHLRV